MGQAVAKNASKNMSKNANTNARKRLPLPAYAAEAV